jgi:hypothetical protein
VRTCVVKDSAPRFLALTAMLLTLGFAGVDGGIVLCFGGDGHVAIEAVGPKGCAEVDETPDHVTSAIAIPVSSSHCGPCVDVVLTTSSASSATEAVKAAKRTPSAPAAISTAELRPRVPHLRASVAYQRTTRFNSEKPHTVVIRC